MPLKNAQYAQIEREMERKRRRHLHLQQQRIDELYQAIPSLTELDQRISELRMKKAELLIFGGASKEEAVAELTGQIDELSAGKQHMITEAGYPPDYTSLRYDCPHCRDTGYLPDGQKCVCLKQAAIDLLYAESNIRDIVRNECFEQFSLDYYSDEPDEKYGISSRRQMTWVLEKCKTYAAEFTRNPSANLLLTGNTGVGKTFLTHCIAREVINQCHSVVYLTAPGLFEMFERSMERSYEDEHEDEITRYLMESDLLIIDDLGTEFYNSFTVSKLFYCLNERLVRKKGVVISTNLSSLDMQNIYSERITSRIFSEYQCLTLFGTDVRMETRPWNNTLISR